MKKSLYILAILLLLAACAGDRVEESPNESTSKEAKISELNEELEGAIACEDLGRVDQLLSKGAELNLRGEFCPPLHSATAKSNKELVAFFMSRGADVNLEDSEGATPLHLAAMYKEKEIAEILIAQGADLNRRDKNGYTPLDYASNSEYKVRSTPDMVKLLRECGAESGSPYRVALFEAAKEGDLALMEELVRKGARIETRDIDQRTLLHDAGSAEVARFLVANGVDVNARDNIGLTPLHNAKTKEVAEILIAAGSYVKARCEGKWTPLHCAARAGNREIAELLIANGADVNARTGCPGGICWGEPFSSATPLHIAAEGGHREVAELLIAKGARVNAKESDDMTMLHRTAIGGHEGLAEYFIRKGVDLNVKDINGRTPLDIAKQEEHKGLVKLLRKHGGKSGSEIEKEE